MSFCQVYDSSERREFQLQKFSPLERLRKLRGINGAIAPCILPRVPLGNGRRPGGMTFRGVVRSENYPVRNYSVASNWAAVIHSDRMKIIGDIFLRRRLMPQPGRF